MSQMVRIQSDVIPFLAYGEVRSMDPFNEEGVILQLDQVYDLVIGEGDNKITRQFDNITVSFMTGCAIKGDDQTDLFYVHPDDLHVLRRALY